MEYTISASKKVEKKERRSALAGRIEGSCSGEVPGIGFADFHLTGMELLHDLFPRQVETDMDLVSFFDGDLFNDPG